MKMKYNYFVWIYSFILTTVTACMGKLENNHDGSWECWIEPVDATRQWIYYYGHMALALVLGLFFWPLGLYRVWVLHWSSRLYDHRIWNYLRHVLFIVLFAMFFVFIISFRVAGDRASQVLSILHMLAVCGIGLYCAIVFGVSIENLKLWRNLFYRQSLTIDDSTDTSSFSSETSNGTHQKKNKTISKRFTFFKT